MMTSKEALERLSNDVKRGNCDYNVEPYIEVIKQDLERLEQLEKENQMLKITVLEYKSQQEVFWDTATNNANLRKENQELKEEYGHLKRDYDLLDIDHCNLLYENQKLKKAIEILKEKPEVLEFGLENFEWDEYQQLYIYVYESYDTIHEYNFFTEEYEEIGSIETEEYSLTKQEYELLKEVLEC